MSDENRTPEAALEILAREMFVSASVAAGDLTARQWRRYWYEPGDMPGRTRWRARSADLIDSLGESGLELTWAGDPDVATLKEQRDHLIALLGNCAAGLRRALDPRTPDDLDAARELLRQAEDALTKYEGVPWVTS